MFNSVVKTLGERIKQARLARGWSGAFLAAKAGYSHQSAIGNLESRATGRGGNKLTDLARALNVSADWLLNGPDSDEVPFIDRNPEQDLQSHQHQVAEPGAHYDVAATQRLDDAMALFTSLSTAGQEEALKYLRFMAAQHAPPIFGADGERDSIPRQRRA